MMLSHWPHSVPDLLRGMLSEVETSIGIAEPSVIWEVLSDRMVTHGVKALVGIPEWVDGELPSAKLRDPGRPTRPSSKTAQPNGMW